MNESGPLGREAPLPPVTTRWGSPVAAPETYAPTLVPPFVPGAPIVQPAAPMPVLRTFDSAPLEEESQADEVAYQGAMNEGFDNGDALTQEIPLEMIPVHAAIIEE